MPQNAAATVSIQPSTNGPDFPADTETITIRTEDFASGGIHQARFKLRNTLGSVLHVRLSPNAGFISVSPLETALGPGDQQIVAVRTDTSAARKAVSDGSPPGAVIEVLYQRLAADGSHESSISAPLRASINVHLPFATCPNCERSLDAAIAEGSLNAVPDICPYCYERLRPCPVCGTPNTWLARLCILDSNHVVRSTPDWAMLGGDSGHSGTSPTVRPAATALARRWSFPGVAPARRENALTWSAPAAAYGLVAAAAATADGDAFIYAFDCRNGSPLWDPFPLPDPVYPDRGGIGLAADNGVKGKAGASVATGRLFAATIGGSCLCLDAVRGTRLWETRLKGRIFGAVVPCLDCGYLLVPVAAESGESGCLAVLDVEDGRIVHKIELDGAPDCAPAYADGFALMHDDGGVLSAVDLNSGAIAWSVVCGAGFDAAPVLRNGKVFSADVTGTLWCHEVQSGAEIWRVAITNSPLSGTPACDGTLLYVPANDGVHVVAAETGRAVRRYATRLPVRSSPIVSGGTLYFGATDGAVYGAAAGRSLERLYETSTIASQIIAAPAMADDMLFVGATNGVLYALSLAPEFGESANVR